MSWNQPICDDCWNERNPDREPSRIVAEHTEQERCSYCGENTKSGIYVRDDPDTVPFPAP